MKTTLALGAIFLLAFLSAGMAFGQADTSATGVIQNPGLDCGTAVAGNDELLIANGDLYRWCMTSNGLDNKARIISGLDYNVRSIIPAGGNLYRTVNNQFRISEFELGSGGGLTQNHWQATTGFPSGLAHGKILMKVPATAASASYTLSFGPRMLMTEQQDPQSLADIDRQVCARVLNSSSGFEYCQKIVGQTSVLVHPATTSPAAGPDYTNLQFYEPDGKTFPHPMNIALGGGKIFFTTAGQASGALYIVPLGNQGEMGKPTIVTNFSGFAFNIENDLYQSALVVSSNRVYFLSDDADGNTLLNVASLSGVMLDQINIGGGSASALTLIASQ